MEDQARSGWLYGLVTDVNDTRLRGNEFVELVVDTGAPELLRVPRPALKTATCELLKHYGQPTVDFWCQGDELRVSFTVINVKRPILSVVVSSFCLRLLALVDEEPAGAVPDPPHVDEES